MRNFFHFVIVAYLILLSGCGYKASPYYSDSATHTKIAESNKESSLRARQSHAW